MDTDTPAIPAFVSQLSGIGIGILVALAVFILTWLILRALVRRWQQRSANLERSADRSLQGFSSRLEAFEAEARGYPPDISDPYQESARDLEALLADGRQAYETLTETLAETTSKEIEAPDRAVAYVLFGFWQEPIFWIRRVSALNQLHERIKTAVAASQPAEELLRDLRAKPLETAHQAQALHQTLTEAANTLNRLDEAGLRGETKENQASLVASALDRLDALPDYFLEGTDSQVIRQASDTEVSQAWQQLTRLEAETRDCAPTIARWWTAYTEFGRALDAAKQAVIRATEALDQTHPTIDVQAWTEAWAHAEAELDELAALYTAPTVEDLEHIERIETLIEDGLDVCSRLASLERDRKVLTQAVPRYREVLKEAETQLRQLCGATQYPLSRLPLQSELDALNQQAIGIGAIDQVRPPAQLAREAEAAQELLRASQTLVKTLIGLRESRTRLLSLVDDMEESVEPDFVVWAEALRERTSLHTPEDWSPDLQVTEIVTDAQALETRRARWIPEDPTEPMPTTDLAQRVDEVGQLIEDGLRYQHRLDRITERLQAIEALDRTSREELGTVYQALDRLALRATDVSPALDHEQSAILASIMDLLEQGYKLDLLFDPPTQHRAEDRATQVRGWLADCEETLKTWMQSLNHELKDLQQTLQSALDALGELAPLTLEPAVQEARARLEAQPSVAPIPRDRQDDARAPHLGTLCEALGDRLRTRTRLHQTLAFLESDVIEALDPPREAWEKARAKAERQMSNLIDLEEEARRLWLPISCDSQAVESQMSAAYASETYLKNHGQTVPQVIATLREAGRTYAKASAMAETRARRHREARSYLERRKNDIETWQGALARYREAHDADPTVVAAVRARLDEIDAAMRQLTQPYQEEGRLVSPEEARRRVEHLWEQARRDLPLGAGYDVIPMRHIERGW